MRIDPSTWPTNVNAAVRHSLNGPKQVALVCGIGVVTFILFMLATFPEYSAQMLSADVFFLDDAFSALLWNFTKTAGTFGVALVAIYAGLTGVAIVNMTTLVRLHGVSNLVAGSSSIAPAFLVGGCAGCGAGILGLFGLVGALGALPFQGNGVRVVGILLILFFLAETGDPETCAV